jgi:hypothetical protein
MYVSKHVKGPRKREGLCLLRVKKVKLTLCLTKHQAMKAYWGSAGIAPRFLDLGTRWS